MLRRASLGVPLLFGLPLLLIAGNTPTTIVLGSSPNPSVFGQPVTLTATVTPSAATGAVTFYDGAAFLGTAKLTGGHATLTVSLLPSLAQPLRAYYAGDSTYAPSTSATVTQTVNSVAGGEFQSTTPFLAGGQLQSVAAGDFNGDGKVGLVASGNTTTVFLGNGDGTFRKAANSNLVAGAVAVGDFNGDGVADLAFASGLTVSVYLGTGNGVFGPPANYQTGQSLSAIAVGDFDGDGKADLVVADVEGQVLVFLGDGTGGFGTPFTSNAGSYPHGLAIGDFNRDGKTDVAIADYFGSSVNVLLGNGDGTFLPPVPYQTGGNTWEVAAGDLNGDGKLDLAAVSGKAVVVFLGNGDGTFGAPATYSTANYGSGVAIGDWDGDGKADLVDLISGDDAIGVFLGNGSGVFQPEVAFPTAGDFPAAVAVGDFNNDGRPDLAMVNQSSGDVTVMLNQPPAPDLSVTVTHVASSLQGQNQGIQYYITVTNLGSHPTAGPITVTDPLPAGFTANFAFGTGWSCSSQPVSCTRNDPLPAFTSFPTITVPVTVTVGSQNSSTNTVSVSGGGETNTANDTAGDFLGTFSQSQISAAWTPVPTPPGLNRTLTVLLLTDGSVMVQQYCTGNWFKLTPDVFGNYAGGSWSQLAPMPSGYAPIYFSSAVLADGRLVVTGGEYNAPCNDITETPLGAVYDPKADVWTSLSPPNGWLQIGDSPNTVLPGGQFLLGASFNPGCCQFARLDPTTLTWTLLPGAGKSDDNEEEGWTLLPDGSILTIDTTNFLGSERYLPQSDTWVSAGTTPSQLSNAGEEMGPQLLRPDGTVFVVGASGHTAIFNTATGTWAAGPDFPVSNGKMINGSDFPAALLPSGNALLTVSGGNAFEFDGTALNPVPPPPSTYCFALLPLPNGQTLCSFQTLALYTPAGSPKPAWAPAIGSAPPTVQPGQTYTISGTQFNGLSQAVGFGDDYQAATNYPLVRIVNNASGHVFYCRTHDHSTMAVATGATPVSTHFDVPASIEAGPSTIVVVANGIPSQPLSLTVSGLELTPANPSIAKGLTQQFTATLYSGGAATDVTASAAWSANAPNGLAAGTAVGVSTITATSGALQASTQLTVTAAALQSIAVSPSNPSIAKGLTQQFAATGHYTDGSAQDITASVTWSANAPGGLATGTAVGVSAITATSGAIQGSTQLTVTPAALVSIAVTPTNPSIAKGLTQQFTATGMFTDSTTQNLTASVTWSANAPNGLAAGTAVGVSTVTANSGAIQGSTQLTVTPAALASIAVTPTNPSIAKGQTQQFTATGTFTDNTAQNLTASATWSANAPNGLATGTAVGVSTVTATSGAIQGSTQLTVTPAALVSIAVTPANPSIAKGLTQQFTATGTYTDSTTQNLTASVTWSANAPNGLATGTAVGVITVTATSGAIQGSTQLTVTPAALVSIAVTPANPSIVKGLTQQFTATGKYTDSSTQDLTASVMWSANAPNGLAAGTAVGVSTITASSGPIQGSTQLTVTPVALQSIALTPASPSIAKGLTQQFTATGTYNDGSTLNITASVNWSSATTSTATVNNLGVATGLGVGTSNITASLNSVTSPIDTLTVTVAALQSIIVRPISFSVAKGPTVQFTATGIYTDNSQQTLPSQVTWASSDTTTAPITTAGLATAAAVGTSTISATLNSVTGSTVFTVTPAALRAITVTPASPSIAQGLTQQFAATGHFSDTSTQDLTAVVTWSSATTTVATIGSAGLATGVGVGTSNITASMGPLTSAVDTLAVTAALQSIAVTPANPSIAQGQTQQFTATGHFSDTSTQDLTASVTWNSAAPVVATIDSAGLATGVGAGTSHITASLNGIASAVDTLTVGGIPATTTALATSGSPALYGAPVTLTATVTPGGATGVVEFLDGATLIGSMPLKSGKAQISTALLPAGANQLSAVYGGAAGSWQPSKSAVVNQSVNASPGNGFLSAVDYDGGPLPRALAVADFNRDGKVDFAVAALFGGVMVYLGNGDGTFQPGVTYDAGTQPESVTVADFNGDGIPDMVVGDQGGGVNVLLGNGDGTFQAAVPYVASTQVYSVGVGDFNGDGIADLAVADFHGSLNVLLGIGDGTFQAPVLYDGGFLAISVAVGDFNGDGFADLAVADYDGGMTTLQGNGDGTFQPSVHYDSAYAPQAVAAGDFNGDGKPDLAVACVGGLSVFVGNGDGTFQPAVDYDAGSNPAAVAVGDFNGDGKADLVVGDQPGGVNVLLGVGDGTFQAAVPYTVEQHPFSIVVADFNGDGRADLAVSQGYTVSVLLAGGGASTMVGNPASTSQAAVAGTPFGVPLTVTVEDAAGNPLPGVSVTFTAPASGASGTFSNSLSSITVVTNASGIASATFNANSAPGGPYQVSATAGSLSAKFVLTNFSPCDFSRQGSTTVADSQLIINEALGLTQAKDDLDGNGVVNVIDVQIVANAVLGLTCTTHSGSN